VESPSDDELLTLTAAEQWLQRAAEVRYATDLAFLEGALASLGRDVAEAARSLEVLLKQRAHPDTQSKVAAKSQKARDAERKLARSLEAFGHGPYRYLLPSGEAVRRDSPELEEFLKRIVYKYINKYLPTINSLSKQLHNLANSPRHVQQKGKGDA
jgi:hypothetical protein